MVNEFNLGGELLFTVRSDGPLRLTQEQVGSPAATGYVHTSGSVLPLLVKGG